MQRIIKVFIILSAICSILSAQTEDEKWRLWFSEKKESYEKAKKLDERERIPALGAIMGNRERITEDTPLFDERISDEYAAFKGTVLGQRKDGDIGAVNREMAWSFRTLSQLPSPETVRVLGDMLSEIWEAEQPSSGDVLRPPSLAVCTVPPLSRLPFIDPPTPPLPDYGGKGNLAAWQQWYAEVKSGERSFAFKGQPVSYRFRPDGSVEAQPRDASEDPVEPVPKQAPRPELKKGPSAEPKPYPASNSRPWLIAAGVALLAAVLGFLFKKRNAAKA